MFAKLYIFSSMQLGWEQTTIWKQRWDPLQISDLQKQYKDDTRRKSRDRDGKHDFKKKKKSIKIKDPRKVGQNGMHMLFIVCAKNIRPIYLAFHSVLQILQRILGSATFHQVKIWTSWMHSFVNCQPCLKKLVK